MCIMSGMELVLLVVRGVCPTEVGAIYYWVMLFIDVGLIFWSFGYG